MTDHQRPLFTVTDHAGGIRNDTGPVARRHDPVTSLAAAEYVTETGLRASQKRQVLDALLLNGPATTAELAVAAQLNRYVVARRMPELAAQQPPLVKVLDKHRCDVTGRQALRWVATGYAPRRPSNKET